MNYWQRLNHFKIYSAERRIERYRVTYIWKSLNGFVPSLGLSWINSGTKSGWHIKYPKVIGPEGKLRSLHRNSMSWEGIRLFNSLPESLRYFSGSKDAFKNLLDKYLEQIPDQPETESLTPGGKDMYGVPSNSIADWPRFLELNNDFSMIIHDELVYPNMSTSNGAGNIPSQDTCV